MFLLLLQLLNFTLHNIKNGTVQHPPLRPLTPPHTSLRITRRALQTKRLTPSQSDKSCSSLPAERHNGALFPSSSLRINKCKSAAQALVSPHGSLIAFALWLRLQTKITLSGKQVQKKYMSTVFTTVCGPEAPKDKVNAFIIVFLCEYHYSLCGESSA